MDAGAILLALALLIIVAAFIMRPLVQGHAPSRNGGVRAESKREVLLRQRDLIYAAIRELDFDFRLGKVSDEDYRPQRERLVAQGVETLKQLDALPSARAGRVEDEIEAEVRRRRSRRTTVGSRDMSGDEIEAQVRALRRKVQPATDAANGETGKAAEFCPQCGTAVQPGDRFCRSCGAALDSREQLSTTGA